MYRLLLRVGKEYYPVNWDQGTVCWESEGYTVFSERGRLEVADQVNLHPLDYKWERIEN